MSTPFFTFTFLLKQGHSCQVPGNKEEVELFLANNALGEPVECYCSRNGYPYRELPRFLNAYQAKNLEFFNKDVSILATSGHVKIVDALDKIIADISGNPAPALNVVNTTHNGKVCDSYSIVDILNAIEESHPTLPDENTSDEDFDHFYSLFCYLKSLRVYFENAIKTGADVMHLNYSEIEFRDYFTKS